MSGVQNPYPSFFPPLGPANGSKGAVAPKGWDKGVLGGQTIPGFTRVTRGNVQLKIDHKKKKGANGANPTFNGMDPQPIEIEIETTSDQDRESLVNILGPYVPQPNRTPTAVSFDHPALRLNGVTSVVITQVGALMPVVGQPMKARIQVGMVHWLPTSSKNATVTPSGAPVRQSKNVRARKPPPTPPTQQAGVAGPPGNLVAL